jgi:sterol desaturase/sphingolipid hydroxylase (fatty acid hydroxylase superfamily)
LPARRSWRSRAGTRAGFAPRRRTRHNFANLAPWLDEVFRTYHRPGEKERFPTGLTVPFPKGYLSQLARPFAPWGDSSRQ